VRSQIWEKEKFKNSLLFAGNLIGLAFPKLVQFLIAAAFIDHDYGKLNRIGLIIISIVP
jgi:hypothetical protein